jgi:Rps23 Pro-64 3,4-dihydroxylase Tpa1-like proline 4-hydroxylase
MPYLDLMNPRTGFILPNAIGDKGKELATEYANAEPFPSVMIDDFLPHELAESLLKHFGPAVVEGNGLDQSYDRAQERLKNSYHPDALDDTARSIFYSFNSRPFIKIIENITGIKGLIPDPYYLGAGYHEIGNGGHLSIHADFNHHKPMNLERRINILIYLNKEWKEDYGGQIELWTDDMGRRVQSHVPTFNRCVIFNTTSTSMHGNPQPVNHPDGVSRKSVALYYYTSTWSDSRRSHTTQFKVRPGSEDKRDWKVRLGEIKTDILPPIMIRALSRLRRTIRS